MALIKCKECGKEISNKAKICVSCGCKISPKISKFVIITIATLVFFIIIGLLVSSNESVIKQKKEEDVRKTDSISVTQTEYRDNLSYDELSKYYDKTIVYRTKSQDHEKLLNALATTYIAYASSTVDSFIRNKSIVTFNVINPDTMESRCNLNDPKIKNQFKLLKSKYTKSITLLTKRLEIIQRQRERELEKQRITIRSNYGELLRNRYLDQSLNIKVTVFGTDNTQIKLTFSLFNEVWTHKIGKGTLIDEIRSLGFKRLTISDGYDYNVYWDL